MVEQHYHHGSYHPTTPPIVHPVDSKGAYAKPLPQPLQHPYRHQTMWNFKEEHHGLTRQISDGPSHQQHRQQRLLQSLSPYQSIRGNEPLMPTEDALFQQFYMLEPDEDPMQHLVLIPLGKTGAGKSSLLNLMLGYDEFKAKAAAKSVTDKITERTGVWVINQTETMITVADTPGFADSMNRDKQFLSVFRESIQDIGSRLEHFDAMMQPFEPKNWWNHVLLVFTRVDYYPNLKFPPNILSKKQSIIETLLPDIQAKFNLSSPPKYAFVSSKPPNCSYTKKGQCDCFAASKYHSDQMRTMKSRVNAILTENDGRWTPVNNTKESMH
ncbi:hypothetical protein A0J61_00697 [Choanephora cucurbitarum]|uniref:AIG1-type G domain-containing protein n=1 Tax=Choanephora cucurbitarum TaxID=101091 RepID=A0A1C7NQQ7_9FUNG|nr:hypothetical protein A0J61_00697 [Choanephora cucurbitarum]